MKHPVLVAEERTVLGKKVKKLRREGLLPANVYGKNLQSTALQIKLADFEAVFKQTGETGLVDLQINGKAKPVLIKNLQKNYHSNTPLHADFYQVNLKEKIKAMIPVIVTGEPQAVIDKVGMLLQTISDVEIEALPDKLPENIEISVEHLAELNQSVTVGDLQAPEGVTILSDAAQTVAKIGELVVQEAEPEPEAEAAEGAATEGEGAAEGTEGEAASEGGAEAPAEEKKEE
jgi:large subunit ribosomal protein L25